MIPEGDCAAPPVRSALHAPAGTAGANLLWSRALVAGLVAGGVRHLCLSPGSRSSPLALAAQAEARIAISVQIDERSAAFLALGIAKATHSPVALVCTSGTAGANYLPAIAEASLSGVPLIVVTADRPPELRATGAAQTIDQIGLYGTHVRSFRDLPCPDDTHASLDGALRAALDACKVARSLPTGPVHLNQPFREPLVPAPSDMPACSAAWSAFMSGRDGRTPTGEDEVLLPDARWPGLAALAARLAQAERPLIVAGPEVGGDGVADAVLAFAGAARIPVFADIASGLRFAKAPAGTTLCTRADLMLRDPALAALAPDFVLRVGGIPTSKALANWLARHRPPVVALQPDARRRDPDGIVGEVIVGDAGALCAALASAAVWNGTRAAWCRLLQIAERGTHAFDAIMPREAAAVVAACATLPEGGALFLSNSMPIRWGEMYVDARAAPLQVFVNRGANGIDGIVSTAVGVARGSGRPTLLVTGDLAFLHDLGGLRSARELQTPLAILVLNNDGGGIFSHLPVAQHRDPFEPLFGTPHGCDLAAASRTAGLAHRVASSIDEVAALTAATFADRAVRVIEWRTDREQSLREQAEVARCAGLYESRIDAGGIGWTVRRRGPRVGTPLVLLHGFTGSGEFWLPVAHALPGRHCVVPDLPGHGGTDAPLPAWRVDEAADALAALLDRMGVDRCALAGYSMGGRLALGFALRHPQRIAALALIGASPGIASADERTARASADLELAASIERDGIDAFAQRWEALPLFATQSALAPALREAMRAQRRAQDPARLAAALRAFSTGWQPPVHAALGALRMPVLVMAGALDTRYAAIGAEMARSIPGASLSVVAGAGHAVPLERADACALEIENFLARSVDR